MEETALQRPDRHQGDEHKRSREDPDLEISETDYHPDRGDHPDGGRGGQAPDVGAVPEDGARAEEAHAGNDLGGDTRRVGAAAEIWLPAGRAGERTGRGP